MAARAEGSQSRRKLLANKYDYSNLTLTQKKEHDILESIIKAAPKGLKIKEVCAKIVRVECTPEGRRIFLNSLTSSNTESQSDMLAFH